VGDAQGTQSGKVVAERASFAGTASRALGLRSKNLGRFHWARLEMNSQSDVVRVHVKSFRAG